MYISLLILSTIGALFEVNQEFLEAVFGQQSRLFSFLISILWLSIGIVAKTFWDHLVERREELTRLRRDKKIEILERQLSEFYWPVYLGLEKSNLIWKQVFMGENNLSPEIKDRLQAHYLLPNHQETIEVLENKIYLARASSELTEQFFLYIRHVAIYQAIRGVGIFDKDPIDFGEPFPKELFQLVCDEKDRLQSEYDHLLNLERDVPKSQRKFRISRPG